MTAGTCKLILFRNRSSDCHQLISLLLHRNININCYEILCHSLYNILNCYPWGPFTYYITLRGRKGSRVFVILCYMGRGGWQKICYITKIKFLQNRVVVKYPTYEQKEQNMKKTAVKF